MASAALAEDIHSGPASREQPSLQAEQEEAPGSSDMRHIVVHLAVSPYLPGPLRGVCIDLDVHPGFGDIIGVSTWPSLDVSARRECVL